MNCRACKYEHTKIYYDFGEMPLANNLEKSKEDSLKANKYPLQLSYCEKCTLSQLTKVISPELLYSHYTYRSSMSKTFKKHCHDLAFKLHNEYGVPAKGDNGNGFLMLDIAGNDGTLGHEFFKVLNGMPLVIDPADNILIHAQDAGCAILKGFWGSEIAQDRLKHERSISRFVDGARIITAMNVFAHVDNVDDFTEGVKIYLEKDGIFICEFPHGLDFIKRAEFDTVYFEHLSYFTLTSFSLIMKRHGLDVFNVEKIDIHGGTLRCWVSHSGERQISPNVDKCLKDENILFDGSVYYEFAKITKNKLNIIAHDLAAYKALGKQVIGFGASAKGNTLLNCLPKEILPKYIIDETPEKIGSFSPGIGLEIKSLENESFYNNFKDVDVVMILSWNFREEMERKLRYNGFTGEVYCPL